MLTSDTRVINELPLGIYVQLLISDIKRITKGESSLYKGQSPQKMQGISIMNRQLLKLLYEADDVLELQCIGEVENINAMPSKVNVHSQ